MPRKSTGAAFFWAELWPAWYGHTLCARSPARGGARQPGSTVLPITPFRGATLLMRVLVVINGFVQGITILWLYAAIVRDLARAEDRSNSRLRRVVLSQLGAHHMGCVHRRSPHSDPVTSCGKSPARSPRRHGGRVALQGMIKAAGRGGPARNTRLKLTARVD